MDASQCHVQKNDSQPQFVQWTIGLVSTRTRTKDERNPLCAIIRLTSITSKTVLLLNKHRIRNLTRTLCILSKVSITQFKRCVGEVACRSWKYFLLNSVFYCDCLSNSHSNLTPRDNQSRRAFSPACLARS